MTPQVRPDVRQIWFCPQFKKILIWFWGLRQVAQWSRYTGICAIILRPCLLPV